MLNDDPLEGKVVVVTGGSQGIGKAIASEFSKHKSKVIILSRTQADVEKSAKEIGLLGGSCEGFVCDVSNADDTKRIIGEIFNQQKQIDLLVNCAGIYGPMGHLESNDLELWKKTIEINLLGTVNSVHAVIPFMKKQGHGKIITLAGGGLGGKNLKPNFSAYTTSKAAVIGFTELLSHELKEFNIQINAVSPGAVNTRLLDQVLSAGELAGKDFLESSKKQKLDGGTPPEKVANLVIFLATQDSDYLSGKTLSAVWDDYQNFDKIKDKLKKSSLFTLRRIDDIYFKEV